MARTRITLTDDAKVPRLAAFPNGVIWYVYIRDADDGLYVQREQSGVRSAEILVAKPVHWLDVIHDPVSSSAYVYFINDESLLRIEVTDSLEAPTLQAYTRSANWYDAIFASPGIGTDAEYAAPDLDPPSISLVNTPSPSLRTLIIAATTTLPKNQDVSRFYVYRDIGAGKGYELYATLAYAGAVIYLSVPTTTTPRTLWYVTQARVVPGRRAESAPSNIEEDAGSVRADGLSSIGGTGTNADWTKIDKSPVKLSAGVDSIAPFGGTGTNADWTKVDKSPVKLSAGVDAVSPIGGTGTNASWVVNGVEVINP
jgi:hypothetical protein